MALASCAPGDDRPFNATEEARRAADAAQQTATSETDAIATEAEVDAWTKGAMVAAADPRAVEAGLEMLRQGGSAIDAAIAVHAVLGLVEPQSSGIGGGAFMVYYDRDADEITVFDGREVAP
ncbi:MAG TPA: gamma-glutamyltransferase, partial [Hyphomonas atlantica]|nr:gamma-glutamyltransferase [Hyphomonas atlantica]